MGSLSRRQCCLRFRSLVRVCWVGVLACSLSIQGTSGEIPVQLLDEYGSPVTVGAQGMVINVTWALQQDGSFVDRIGVFHKYEPCDLLASVDFETPSSLGYHELSLPSGTAASESYSVHVFKASNGTVFSSSCAWDDLSPTSHGAADVTAMLHSALALPGAEPHGPLQFPSSLLERSICSRAAESFAFSVEFWMRCAGSCDGQVLLDSSSSCGFRVRVLSELQTTFGMTGVPELLDTDEFYARNAYSFLPDRIPAVQLEIFSDRLRGVSLYNISVPAVVADKSWHHVAVVRDSDGGTRLVVDGVPSRTHDLESGLDWATVLDDGASAAAVNGETTSVFLGGPSLGGGGGQANESFSGFLAEVRAWNGSLSTPALASMLQAQVRFEDARSILISGGSATPGANGKGSAADPISPLGEWPLTLASRFNSTVLAGASFGNALQNASASLRFRPVAIGPLTANEDNMDPAAIRVTCETQASEALFLTEPAGDTGQYVVQCPKEVCNNTIDDFDVETALANKRRRLPVDVPICYSARQTSIVSASNQGFEFTVLQMNFGQGPTNYSGVVQTSSYVNLKVPVLVRGVSAARLEEADQQTDTATISVSMGHQPLCEGLLNPESGICYNFTGTMMKWTDAWDHCASWGGTPAIVRSASDFLFVRRQFSVFNMSNLAWLGGVSLDPEAERLVASIDSGSYIQNPDSPATDEVAPYEYAIFSDWYESVLAETELSVICEKIESYYVTLYTPLGGPAFSDPQKIEITSVFWDLWWVHVHVHVCVYACALCALCVCACGRWRCCDVLASAWVPRCFQHSGLP